MLALEPTPHVVLADAGFDEARGAIGFFADIKSPSRLGHSAAVADLVTRAARAARWADGDVRLARAAALVHDLGIAGVSAGILEKRGALSDAERERVRLHAYYTERCLVRSPVLRRVGAVAALSHERVDGSGYPRGPVTLAAAARLLAAADVYAALIADRPHRAALTPVAARAALLEHVRAGELDAAMVDAVLVAAGAEPDRARPERARDALTEREIQVLGWVARGLTNKAIAQRLDIATKTVGHHVQHIFEKLGVTTRAAAAFHALKLGALPEV